MLNKTIHIINVFVEYLWRVDLIKQENKQKNWCIDSDLLIEL